MSNFISDFVTLWVVIDPIGTIPLFLAASAGRKPAELRQMALVSVAIASGLLIAFMFLGQLLLGALGISVTSFQIAGGVVLFTFALRMTLGSDEKTASRKLPPPLESAVFPLAMPSIAGPGSMLAVVVLTDSDRYSLMEQGRTAIVLLVVMAVQLALLLGASRVQKFLGNMGINILSRVMGLILCAVAAQNIITGVQAAFGR
jgi:multiple antibiotic resistance protein